MPYALGRFNFNCVHYIQYRPIQNRPAPPLCLQKGKQMKLRYYAHIRRKVGTIQTILEGRMEGRRPRGRPRQTWFSNITRWTGMEARRCIAEATDRHLWSVITRQPLDWR